MNKEIEIPIGYCGKKDSETDHLYGTNLTWTPGDVHPVPLSIAVKLLKHEDVYYDARPDEGEDAPGDLAAMAKDAQKDNAPAKTEADDLDEQHTHELAPLVSLEAMNKADIVAYAHRHFGVELPASETKAAMIEQVRGMMGKRG